MGVTDCTGFGESNLQQQILSENVELKSCKKKKSNSSFDLINYFLDELKLKLPFRFTKMIFTKGKISA